MTGSPSADRLANDELVIGPVNDTIPFSSMYTLLTVVEPNVIGNPSATAPVDALPVSVSGHDSACVEVISEHAPEPSPNVASPKSSPSLETGPKSTLM